MIVEVAPMSRRIRAMPEAWRPLPQPIFQHGSPTDADRELARDLWRALDLESRRWYWRAGACALLNLTARDLAGMRRRSSSAS